MKITNLDDVNGYNYTSTSKKTSGDGSFDEILDAAKIIYAVPESSANSDAAGKTPVTSPEDMEVFFQNAADTYGVSLALLKAVAKAESDFNPNCTSSAGAMGVMQLMPDTAKTLGVTNPYDTEQSIMGGAKLLSQLLQKYNGDTSLALAAYNAGSGNVDKYGGIPPFKETQNYVSKILGYLGMPVSDANTIYAVAAKDATNPDSFYTINAVPENM